MRTTHAYRLNGIETPRESLMQVCVVIDGKARYLSAQAAEELADDLRTAATDAEDQARQVRASLIGR